MYTTSWDIRTKLAGIAVQPLIKSRQLNCHQISANESSLPFQVVFACMQSGVDVTTQARCAALIIEFGFQSEHEMLLVLVRQSSRLPNCFTCFPLLSGTTTHILTTPPSKEIESGHAIEMVVSLGPQNRGLGTDKFKSQVSSGRRGTWTCVRGQDIVLICHSFCEEVWASTHVLQIFLSSHVQGLHNHAIHW